MNIESFYDTIADEFDKTRIRLWNCVIQFLNSFKSNSKILDIGCGNGKYLNYRNDLNMYGIDISIKLVDICKNKGFNVVKANMNDLPFETNYFDGIICIASYHHLDNEIDRQKTINEIYRVLKPNGIAFIEVWSKEQIDNSNKNTINFKDKSNLVKWTSIKTGNIYYRYYNIYSYGELEKEITALKPEFKIIDNGYEKGNYFVKLLKN